MTRSGKCGWVAVACLCSASLGVGQPTISIAGQVSGIVKMPEVCSSRVSPAVVYLAPAGPNGKAIRVAGLNRDPRPGLTTGPNGADLKLGGGGQRSMTPDV